MYSTFSSIIVSYYSSYSDAIRHVNRNTYRFPMLENYNTGRDGILDTHEVGINILEYYGLIDSNDRKSTIIMYVEPIK